jgi:hypothetical protein
LSGTCAGLTHRRESQMSHTWAALAAAALLGLAACSPDDLASPARRPAPAQGGADTVPAPNAFERDGGGGVNTTADRFASG